jgi:hypothetical protein
VRLAFIRNTTASHPVTITITQYRVINLMVTRLHFSLYTTGVYYYQNSLGSLTFASSADHTTAPMLSIFTAALVA